MDSNETAIDTNEPINADEYIAAMQEMQQNSVPREDYEKLKEENRNLIRSLARGERLTEEDDAISPVERQNLTDDLLRYDNSDNNLNYVKKALKLREIIMSQGEDDPFVPNGPNMQPTESDRAAAQRVADTLQECLEIADNDNAAFTAALLQRMKDNSPAGIKKYK